MSKEESNIISDYKYGFSKPEEHVYKSNKGLTSEKIRQISNMKGEPEWMLEFRLKAYDTFLAKSMPNWGADLSEIDFEDIFYYIKPTENQKKTWEELPKGIKDTYDKLGIPEAERNFLAGVSAQYESEVVYHSLIKELSDQGVIFTDMDTGLREYGDIVKKYFGTLIPSADNKFSALNSAVWSGGSFVYVPKGVKVKIPLQAYFRINAENMGQFERTLIIAEEDSFVHYIEGCFLAGAKVKTKFGEIAIENIKIGDEVFTHKGRYKKVYNTMKRPYIGKIYEIKYFGDSGATLNITEEHPILVCKRTKKEYRNINFIPQWSTAKELGIGDYLAYPIYKDIDTNSLEIKEPAIVSEKVLSTVNEPYINKYKPQVNIAISFGFGRHKSKKILNLNIDKDFFRLIGYYLAEGHIEKEHYVTFTFNKNETQYIDDVINLTKTYFDKDIIIGKERNNGITLTLCSTLAARFIAKEFGETCSKKQIPSWVIESPNDNLKELINGMWKGDGSFDLKRNLFRYSSVNRNLVNNFRDILLKFGIISSLNTQKRNSRQTMYTVVISRTCNMKFGEIVDIISTNGRKEGSPFYMDDNYIYLPIKSIKIRAAKDIVYNFSVEDDESYVAEGIISHNCTAPIYSTNSLHSAVVEIFCMPGSRVRYTTVQNWANNVYNLVTKRAVAYENSIMEWIDGNIGSKRTMKYPSIYLKGKGAKGIVVSAAYAGKDQHQDTGTKIFHMAPNTSSEVIAKSVSQDNGKTTYRGMISVAKGAVNSKISVKCDALLLNDESTTDTIPVNITNEEDLEIAHEASISRMKDTQLNYLKSRGLTDDASGSMIVNGFMEPFTRELPMEYAIELNRLIDMNMEGSVG